MLELSSVKASNFIGSAVDIEQMSVSFETLYMDSRVQTFLKKNRI